MGSGRPLSELRTEGSVRAGKSDELFPDTAS